VLRRWQEAQKAEKLYWETEGVVDLKTNEILKRYSRVFSEIKSDAKWMILDVGCGPTIVSRIVKDGEKFGVDPLMDHFIEKVKNKGALASFHFLMGLGECLPFRTGCFDLVICRNVLDHVQFPEEVLKEMKRVSKGSAIVLLGVNVHSEFVSRIKKDVERMRIIGLREEYHPYFFTEDILRNMCSKYFSMVKKRVVFSDKAGWIKIECKMPEIRNYRWKTKFFTLPWSLTFILSLFVTLFWNIIRFLNKLKAPYFSSEYAIIAH
jgi:ubiquinone/menaquinone biosynthesis C-methylase UbiE